MKEFTPEQFQTALSTFLAGAQEKVNKQYETHFDGNRTPKLVINGGTKYLKIQSVHEHQKCAYCFIDTTNGNVLKSAGWKKPELRNPRSNIFDPDNGLSGVDWHGAVYLR